jgi:hypothetical protein
MRGIRPGACGLAVLGVFAAGCGRSEQTVPSSVQVRDSAGVTIVDNGTLALDRRLAVGATPAVEIGVLDGPQEYQLFQVSDAARLPDGGFAIANAGSREVRVYDADGSHRVTVGGDGDGPSEFRYPAFVTVRGEDTIQVQDRIDRVFFAMDGAFLGRATTDFGRMQALWESIGFSEGGEWTPNGGFLASVHPREVASDWRPGPLVRPQLRLMLVSPDLSGLDALGVFGGIEQQFVDVGDAAAPNGLMPVVPPFATNTSWAAGAADGTIVVGDNALPQFVLFGPAGGKRIVRWSAEPEPVSSDEVEAWLDRQRSASWTKGRLPRFERAWAQMDVPETKAYFDEVVIGRTGIVWIRADWDEESRVSSFLGFDADGAFVGRTRIPGAFKVFDIGDDWVLGLYRDESDVEYVRLYALVASPGA